MIRICLIVFFSLIISFVGAQTLNSTTASDTGLVKWMSFKEAFRLNEKQPKPFLIDVYTDWCGWCKHMIKTTYSNPGIAGYINTYFYPVKFDAETQDTIEYLGTKYFNPTQAKRSTHQLAIKLLGQKLSYPSTIFINNNFQFNLLSQGYLEVKKIEPLLIFTVENIFRTTAYDDFRKYYEKAFPETPVDKSPKPVKWYSINEALELNKKEPRKFLINIYTDWCNSCKVMNKTTYTDSLISDYLEENFYLVDLNAENKEPINFAGQQFLNDGSNGTPFHSFVLALLKGNVTLPTAVIMNEKNEILDVLSFYLTPETLEPITHFYGEDAFKSVKWEEFKKSYAERKSAPVKK